MIRLHKSITAVANILDKIFRTLSFAGLVAMLFLGTMEVSYFYNQMFTPKVQRYTDLIVDIFLVVILIVLFKNTILVIQMEQYQSSLINIPMKSYWYTMPLLLGCILALLSRVEGILALVAKEKMT